MKPTAMLCRCGEVFTTTDPRQRNCRKDCGRKRVNRSSESRNGSRKVRAKQSQENFVSVDGEGVDRYDGSHEYVLLSIGEESLTNRRGEELGLEQIFDFLYGYHEDDPTGVYVGFFLGYDFAQWFKHLPEDRARMLYTDEGRMARLRKGSGGNPTPFPVRWKGWEFDIMADRRFKLRPQAGGKWMYVCDAGPFFQTAFTNVINPKAWPEDERPCTPEEFEIIAEGKANRSSYKLRRGVQVPPEMIRYNAMENRIMANVMQRLNAGLLNMGVTLNKKQWFGPGQAANAWLANVAPEHEGESVREACPEDALQAARSTYYGGWFELMCHGVFQDTTVYEYDINSAYPTITAELPCLLHGKWTHGEGEPPSGDYVMAKLSAVGSNPYIGALMHRTHKGNVCRPWTTTGWHWMHEVNASQRAGLIDTIDYHEWWKYEPCDCPLPLRSIADLYQQRRAAKAAAPGGAEEKALKLAYNSAYGKLAQSVGNPRWSNPVYASLITAGCRTMITDAIATHPDGPEAVVMVATDGVYFMAPHPHLDQGSDLGQWEGVPKEQFAVFKPGVHWYRDGEEMHTGIKSRGVNARALAPRLADIETLWLNWDGRGFDVEGDNLTLDGWPNLTITVPFTVISPRLALNLNDWTLAGSTKTNFPLKASANPRTKRDALTEAVRHGDTWWRTSPLPAGWYGQEEGTETEYYDRAFGLDTGDGDRDPFGMSNQLQGHVVQEGPIVLLMRG